MSDLYDRCSHNERPSKCLYCKDAEIERLREWQRRAMEPMRRRAARCNLCAGRGYVFNTTDSCPACATDRALIEEAGHE